MTLAGLWLLLWEEGGLVIERILTLEWFVLGHRGSGLDLFPGFPPVDTLARGPCWSTQSSLRGKQEQRFWILEIPRQLSQADQQQGTTQNSKSLASNSPGPASSLLAGVSC